MYVGVRYAKKPQSPPNTCPHRVTTQGPRLPPRQESRYLSAFEELMLRWKDSEVEFFVPQLAAVLMSKGVPSRNVHVSPGVRLVQCRYGHHRGRALIRHVVDSGVVGRMDEWIGVDEDGYLVGSHGRYSRSRGGGQDRLQSMTPTQTLLLSPRKLEGQTRTDRSLFSDPNNFNDPRVDAGR